MRLGTEGVKIETYVDTYEMNILELPQLRNVWLEFLSLSLWLSREARPAGVPAYRQHLEGVKGIAGAILNTLPRKF